MSWLCLFRFSVDRRVPAPTSRIVTPGRTSVLSVETPERAAPISGRARSAGRFSLR